MVSVFEHFQWMFVVFCCRHSQKPIDMYTVSLLIKPIHGHSDTCSARVIRQQTNLFYKYNDFTAGAFESETQAMIIIISDGNTKIV